MSSVDRSRHSLVTIECRCPTGGQAVQWDLVDASARPDLREAALAGQLEHLGCRGCGATAGREGPLVWIAALGAAHAVFVFSDGGGAQGQAQPDWFDDLWRSLTERAPAVVVHLDRGGLPLIAARDMAVDLGDPVAAADAVLADFGKEAAEFYSGLLNHVAQALTAEPVVSAVAALHEVGDAPSFKALLDRCPVLLSDETLDYVDERGQGADDPAHSQALRRCLLLARDDVDEAWAYWEGYLAAAWERHGEPVARQLEEFAKLAEAGEPTAIRRLGEEILEASPMLTPDMELLLRTGVANAWLASEGNGPNKGMALDHAVGHLERALEMAPPDMRGDILVDLAVAYGDRITGDRRSNLDRGIGYLEEAIAVFEATADYSSQARAHTNLAYLLRRRPSADPLADLRASRDHCMVALKWRRPDIDADDWAHTQINLGVAIAALAAMGEADPQEAVDAYQQVVDQAEAITDSSVVALAWTDIASVHTRLAAVAGNEGDQKEWDRRLEIARGALQEATDLYPDQHINLGRTLRQLGDIHGELGDRDAAITLYERAREILTVESDPDEARDALWGLGALHAMRGEWPQAADALRSAVEAGELRIHSSLETHDREQASRQLGRLPRWAAYAMARVGHLEEAVLTLENGRARELRRRIGTDTEMAEVDELRLIAPGLYEEYAATARALRAGHFQTDGDERGRALQDVVERIRQLPALAHFGTSVSMADVGAAIGEGQPLVYLDPTPYGTLALVLRRRDRDVEIEPLWLEATSQDLFSTLAFERPPGGSLSYFAALFADDPSEADFHAAIDYGLRWVGDRFVRPLLEEVTADDTQTLTVVPCGPLGAVPLGGCSWDSNGRRTYGVDLAAIRIAPSAVVQSACRQRAESVQPQRLVALADPSGWDPLPAARAEIGQIEEHFSDAAIGIGRDATRDFLAANASSASYLHLACHARSDSEDVRRSRLFLADGELTLAEISGVTELRTRLAVASACESGRGQLDEEADEMLSLGVALIAMGSAGAIATQWSIDDYATALLMTRLYEELAADQAEPVAALRAAQRWLRDLTDAEHERYLNERPTLASELRRRCEEGRRPGRRGSGSAAVGPFSHPDFWAAFVLYGT